MTLTIADKSFESRLFTGTGKFASGRLMAQTIETSGSQLVTLSLKRVDLQKQDDNILQYLKPLNVQLLPNTSGARTAKEAVFAAQLGQEALNTNWVKLEIHPDPKYLMPDPIETLQAAKQLCDLGFVVLPYCSADPVLCKRLAEVGCAAVMPLGAAIGSNQGLSTRSMLDIIIEQADVPVVIDAGIGAPSDAALAMEIGADAVLVNTAMAVSPNSIAMGKAFKLAVQAGFNARQAGLGKMAKGANATSSLTGFLSEASA